MCEKLGIKSTKDTEQLKKAKDEVYLKGFYEGVMLVGECKGMKVCDAKPIVRQSMINNGDAIPYFEPESMVMSRSGDECIVALTDQWYLAYGEPEWAEVVSKHIHSKNFNGYNDKIMEQFDLILGWLKEWACTRQFGLGTQLPWDQRWVIESLSDSTVYMAYYTIAHILHGGINNLKGTNTTAVKAEDLTDEVFNYIFLNQSFPENYTCNVNPSILQEMKKEFEYWYPFDLRVSAKDLIPNHLTMSLYNHIEIWKDFPERWPGGIYCNGQIMVNAEKMSKSKGNFLMLLECIEEYSADATRFALADAGDTLEDANFDKAVANQAIQYLYVEEDWIRSIVNLPINERRDGELSFMDRTFSTEIDYLIEETQREFQKLCYREGIHRCWYDMLIARDIYRDWISKCGISVHYPTIMKFIHSLVIMISPICPHWSENLWKNVLQDTLLTTVKVNSIHQALWPQYTQQCDPSIRKQYIFFKDVLRAFRLSVLKTTTSGITEKGRGAHVYISSTYEDKKVLILKFLQSLYDQSTKTFPIDLLKKMKVFVESDPLWKKETKVLMQFGAFMRDEALERGYDALAISLDFDQKQILQVNENYIRISLELTEIQFINTSESFNSSYDKKKFESAVPGKPSYHFYALK